MFKIDKYQAKQILASVDSKCAVLQSYSLNSVGVAYFGRLYLSNHIYIQLYAVQVLWLPIFPLRLYLNGDSDKGTICCGSISWLKFMKICKLKGLVKLFISVFLGGIGTAVIFIGAILLMVGFITAIRKIL